MKTTKEFIYKTKQMQRQLLEIRNLVIKDNGELYDKIDKDVEELEQNFFKILQKQHDYSFRREELRLENLYNRLSDANKKELDLFFKNADKEAIEYIYNKIGEAMDEAGVKNESEGLDWHEITKSQ